ncbi:cytochrome c [Cyclobacterium lianum]|uniref:Cytochrome c n=1 Tax=Cyclobacterium lianum TaxID=388280 RepID=A0A1M7Q5D8_9BACT|nr:PQQ-dependent sugar dehydrogenase [Cyclobacterium lianum]SHN25614.1 cytochrome c [Cyclobacterium lianum]
MVLVLQACSEQPINDVGSGEAPDPTRFTYETIADGLDEPLQLEFDVQGNVYFIERTGAVKMIAPGGGNVSLLGKVALATEKAPGLIGILLNRDFQENRQLFLYYSALEDKGEYMRLSRFTLDGSGQMLSDTEVILLQVPWEQPDGEHFGGGMCWDLDGNLLLSVGGDSAPTAYAPLPFSNEGGRGQDSGRTAGNSNDLRGSILRISPQPDGSYTIPAGNLFPKDHPKARPEIYVMGNRNPWRLSIDSQTGFLHWGEVGPDAGEDSDEFGPMGYDEFNVAREAGNFGWPFFIGKNRPYNRYDYATKAFGDAYNPQIPVNTSPNNTGLDSLPPARPALLAYPYRVSEEWPILRSAARSAVGGPVFRQSDFREGTPGRFPAFFEGKWLVTDYVRNWIMVLEMDEDRRKVTDIWPLMPANRLQHKQPLDMDFGPDGALYLVEYGRAGQGRLSRIKYNAGNRKPIAHASASRTAGGMPLKVRLSSAGSVDHDGDELSYHWVIQPLGGGETINSDEAQPEITLERAGRYEVSLTVRDSGGEMDQTSFEILAGNHRPEVSINIRQGNKSFFFPNQRIAYEVKVEDQEDGSTAEGTLPENEISFTAEYIPSGIQKEELNRMEERGLTRGGTSIRHLKAIALLQQYNCMTCHQIDSKLVGPSYREVSRKYAGRRHAEDTLFSSIVRGVSGKWGESVMPPHPMLGAAETNQIIDYILSQGQDKGVNQELPLKGEFVLTPRELTGPVSRLGKFFTFDSEPGSYVFRASYEDQGVPESEDLRLRGSEFHLLRYPILAPETADSLSEAGISYTPSTDDPGFMITGKGGFLGFEAIDLTGVASVNIGAVTRFWYWSHYIGGTVALRLGSPDGKLMGTPFKIIPPADEDDKGPFFGEAAGKPVSVDLSDVEGVHDIYIVISNEDARESDALMIMTGIEFIPE